MMLFQLFVLSLFLVDCKHSCYQLNRTIKIPLIMNSFNSFIKDHLLILASYRIIIIALMIKLIRIILILIQTFYLTYQSNLKITILISNNNWKLKFKIKFKLSNKGIVKIVSFKIKSVISVIIGLILRILLMDFLMHSCML